MPTFDGYGLGFPEGVPKAQEYCDSKACAAGATTIVGGSGLIPPDTATPGAPTVAAGAAGALTGTYKWLIVYADGYGQRGLAGTASAGQALTAQRGSLTAIPTSANAAVTQRLIYRTYAGGSVYYYAGVIPDNTTTTYIDNLPDSSLGPAQMNPRYPRQLYSVVVNATAASQTVIIYDNETGASSGKIIWQCTAAGAGQIEFAPCVPVIAKLGLTVVTVGAAAIVYFS